jgi:hypothetical protein
LYCIYGFCIFMTCSTSYSHFWLTLDPRNVMYVCMYVYIWLCQKQHLESRQGTNEINNLNLNILVCLFLTYFLVKGSWKIWMKNQLSNLFLFLIKWLWYIRNIQWKCKTCMMVHFHGDRQTTLSQKRELYLLLGRSLSSLCCSSESIRTLLCLMEQYAFIASEPEKVDF